MVGSIVTKRGSRTILEFDSAVNSFEGVSTNVAYDLVIIHRSDWEDLSWLKNLGLKASELIVKGPGIKSFNGLNDIGGVRKLELEYGGSYRDLDLISFSNLESLTLDWSNKLVSQIAQLNTLESLAITRYGHESLVELSTLQSLKHLELTQGSAKALTGIEKMSALETLALSNVRGLSDIDSIALTANLKSLSIENCSKINSFQSIGGCENLEKIWLDTKSEQTIDCSALLKNQQLNKLLSVPVVANVDWATLLSLKTIDDIRISVEIGNAPTEKQVLQICSNCNRTLLKFELTKRKGKVGVFIVLEPVNGFPHPPFLLS